MITGNVLKKAGWKPGRALGLAKAAAEAMTDADVDLDRSAILNRLDAVRQSPADFLEDPILGPLATELDRVGQQDVRRAAERAENRELRAEPLPYRVWGAEGIDEGAQAQMRAAMRLPVTVAGALMPDAHVGYGLPIGGVLATHQSVIPYAVGVDIACRMRLSLYEEDPQAFDRNAQTYRQALMHKTYFGAGVKNPDRPDHPVLHDGAWEDTRLLHGLRDLARQQLGTSGTGNHFVEWGWIDLTEADRHLGVVPGRYLALLSHSGSRGVGFKIANAFSQIAMERHRMLDPSVKHLAWLSMLDDAGQEYWHAMQLAGRFASANHAVIHRAVAKAAGVKEIAAIENHHNFAWKETVQDAIGAEMEVIVHRKGATPAGQGVLGVIPGSMADPGFLVRGRGVLDSLQSAAHGAGRQMGRRAAIAAIAKSDRDSYLKERGITLLGGGIDESPQAYKRIETVIAAQSDLVDILGEFHPKIVRMASEAGDI